MPINYRFYNIVSFRITREDTAERVVSSISGGDQILANFGYLGGFSAAGGDLLIYRPFRCREIGLNSLVRLLRAYNCLN
jgi:hypothetical protein